MNKVKIEDGVIKGATKGDIFEKAADIYILAVIDGKYCLVDLECGNTWNGLHDTIEQAVGHSAFIGRNLTITISK